MRLEQVCLATTFFLIGCGESATPPTATPPTAVLSSWENSLGMSFKDLPAGEFMMGSPLSERGRYPNEVQRRVTLTKAFSIGVSEVTQWQYEQVVRSNPSSCKGEHNPVENILWEDAVGFCRKLSALKAEHAAGRKYRLPTEAEWEFACRAGTTTAYNFGENASQLGEFEWFDENSGRTTHAVGTKRSNKWGLYDMHGNASEWCSNWYDEYSSDPVSDPLGPQSGKYRVYRGGLFYDSARFCRSAYRCSNPTWLKAPGLGFRVALTLESLEDANAAEDTEKIKGQ